MTTYEVGVLTRAGKSSSNENSGTAAESSDCRHADAPCCNDRATVSREPPAVTSDQTSTDSSDRLAIVMSRVSACRCRLELAEIP